MLPVEQPFKTYTGLDGKPLDNGYVYFGQPNQDPIAHPVTVYWDAAGTQPAAQPLRTVKGYIMNAGTPANVFFDSSYSELVKDSKGRQVFYARTSDEFSFVSAVLALLTFLRNAVGAVARTFNNKEADVLSVRDFTGDLIDGVTSNQAAIEAAVLYAYQASAVLYWPAGTYVSTASIPYLHKVRHVGPGKIKRGLSSFSPDPLSDRVNNLYISPTGSATNDGLTASEPMTEAAVFAILPNYGPVLEGIWRVYLAAGTYQGGVSMTGLRSRNYIEFYGPDVGGHPNVPTAIIDGTGSVKDHGWYFERSMFIRIQDIKFQNQQSQRYSHGVTAIEGCKLWTVNVHSENVAYGGIDVESNSKLLCSGGVHNNYVFGIRAVYHCVVNIGYNGGTGAGRPQIRGAREGNSGIMLAEYCQGHIDYCDIFDCVASGGAVGLFNNSRVDITYSTFGGNSLPNYYNVLCAIGSTYIDNVGNTFNAAVIKSIHLTGFSIDWNNKDLVMYDQATGRLRIGITPSLSAPAARLHIKEGEAGASYATNTVLAVESATNSYISLGSPGTGEAGIQVCKPGQSLLGRFFYNYTDDSWRMVSAASNTAFRWSTTQFIPPSDNATGLGTGSYRWSQVYAGTGAINTSDGRAKQQWTADLAPELRAWERVRFGKYKFNDAVTEKGADARWHIGLIAQDVKAAFEAEGLDAFAYGLLCYDEWPDEYEPVYGERIVTDAAGLETVEQYDTGTRRLVTAAGNRYGIRYEEALALECAYLRSKLSA